MLRLSVGEYRKIGVIYDAPQNYELHQEWTVMIRPRHFPPLALTIFVLFFLYRRRPDQLVFSYPVMIKADSFPQIVYEQHCLEKEQVAGSEKGAPAP